jgi:hypothetical protein
MLCVADFGFSKNWIPNHIFFFFFFFYFFFFFFLLLLLLLLLPSACAPDAPQP